MFYAADFETHYDEAADRAEVIAWSAVGGDGEHYGTTIETFITWLHTVQPGEKVYMHNGSGFDFFFLIDFLSGIILHSIIPFITTVFIHWTLIK